MKLLVFGRKYPRNMCTQYEPRELPSEEKENILQLENLKNVLNSVSARSVCGILPLINTEF